VTQVSHALDRIEATFDDPNLVSTLVMGPPIGHPPVCFRVHVDGRAPRAAAGVDVDADGNGTAEYQRMYQLIRHPGPINDRPFEIEFLDAGIEAFVLTFG
jgi:hypothetical protein